MHQLTHSILWIEKVPTSCRIHVHPSRDYLEDEVNSCQLASRGPLEVQALSWDPLFDHQYSRPLPGSEKCIYFLLTIIILVAWLCSLYLFFENLPKTFFIFFFLFFQVSRDELQLAGVSCMLIASKFEEIYTPSIEDFLYVCNDTLASLSTSYFLTLQIFILLYLFLPSLPFPFLSFPFRVPVHASFPLFPCMDSMFSKGNQA